MLDDYNFHQQSEEVRLLTEARLLLSPELQDKLHWQQQVYELVQLYGRRRLKEEMEAVHEQLFTESRFEKFRSRIYRIFKKS
jgi:hypothetical protein